MNRPRPSFALPEDMAETLDRQLGDGTADEVSAHLGELGEGEAAAIVVCASSCYLSVVWYAHGRTWATWWIATRDARGGLVLAGPTGDPSRVSARDP